jgi:hypothetical protein
MLMRVYFRLLSGCFKQKELHPTKPKIDYTTENAASLPILRMCPTCNTRATRRGVLKWTPQGEDPEVDTTGEGAWLVMKGVRGKSIRILKGYSSVIIYIGNLNVSISIGILWVLL